MLLLLACCAVKAPLEVPKVVEVNWEKDYHFDTTVGSYGEEREQPLILLTIACETHRSMVEAAHGVSQADQQEPPLLNYDEFITLLEGQHGLSRVADWSIPPIDIQCLIFESGTNQSIETVLAVLSKMPEVEMVQPVQRFNTLQVAAYNDPYLPLQHSMNSAQIGRTHQLSYGRGATVAIIDTGFDTENIEFANRIVSSRNYVDKDEEQFRSDVHGMAVAGVIAAAANNETGMVGIAPQASLLPMKACGNTDSSGGQAQCNSITLLKALDDAIQANVDVINLSLAGPRDPLLERMVLTAIEQGIVVVSASPSDNSTPFASVVEGTISVSDQPSGRRGRVMAPGRKVLSLHPKERYKFYDGNSFSAAHVSGVVALVRGLVPGIGAAETLSLLKATADFDSGKVNACRAVSYVARADSALCESE